MAWQLIQLSERSIEYRQSTGALVPRNEWRRWLAMFVHGDPQLGDPVIKKEQVRMGVFVILRLLGVSLLLQGQRITCK